MWNINIVLTIINIEYISILTLGSFFIEINMEPIVGANLLHNPVGEMRRQFGDDPRDASYIDLTDKLLGGGLLSRMLGGTERTDPVEKIIDEKKRSFFVSPLQAVKGAVDGVREEIANPIISKLDILVELETRITELFPDNEQLDGWMGWFLDNLHAIDDRVLAKLYKAEDEPDLIEGIGRREFLAGGSAVVGTAALVHGPIKAVIPRSVAPAATLPNPNASTEAHNSRISAWDLRTAKGVSGVFAGIILAQFAGLTEMSPKTSAVMLTMWLGRLALLEADSRGHFGSSKEDMIASKAALDHEKAELGNIKVAFLLASAAEVASHFYLDRNYGKVNAEELWSMISEGNTVSVRLNGGTENVDLTFADFEKWMTVEKASDISPERTDIVKRIISGEGLSEIEDEEIAALIEEWVSDVRVETKLDMFEDAKYERELLLSRPGDNLWTTATRLNENDPDEMSAEDFRFAGHVRMWIKKRDGIVDEIAQVNITEGDLREYLDSREEEISNTLTELDEGILQLEENIREGVWKMNAMSMIFAPGALTFTSAGIVNGYMKELAVKIYELGALRELKQSGRVDAHYHEDANKFAVKAIAGKSGLLHVLKALATNLHGAALFGDPPNIFFRQNHGDREWKINSAVGFVLSSAITGAEINLFLSTSGINLTKRERVTFKEALSTGINGLGNIGRSIVKRDKIGGTLKQEGKHMIDTSLKSTGMYDPAKAASEGIGSLINTALQGGAYVLQKVTGTEDNAIQKLAQKSGLAQKDYLNIDNEALAHGLGGKALEMAYNPDVPFRMMIGAFKNVYERVSKGDLLGSLRQIDPSIDSDQERMEVLAKLEELKSSGDVDGMAKYLVEHGIVEKDAVDSIREGAEHKGENPKEGHSEDHGHKLSHGALDVRNALLTQLWAVGSLQVVVKKALKLDQDIKMTKSEALTKIAMILGTIAGISGIADNVAAMLYGINVLEDLGRKAVGEEEYENNKMFQESLRRWAFLTAVASGCLTLIGNGPNMLLEVLDEIYRDDQSDILDAITRKMKMSESALNLYGPLSVLTTLAVGFGEISYHMSKIDFADESEEASKETH